MLLMVRLLNLSFQNELSIGPTGCLYHIKLCESTLRPNTAREGYVT